MNYLKERGRTVYGGLHTGSCNSYAALSGKMNMIPKPKPSFSGLLNICGMLWTIRLTMMQAGEDLWFVQFNPYNNNNNNKHFIIKLTIAVFYSKVMKF